MLQIEMNASCQEDMSVFGIWRTVACFKLRLGFMMYVHICVGGPKETACLDLTNEMFPEMPRVKCRFLRISGFQTVRNGECNW